MIKCIIVEDNFLTAVNIQRMVEELGYQVLTVLHNKDQVERSTNFEEADVILSDVKIGVDTFVFDVLNDKISDTPVVLFSSHVDMELYEQCKKIKPYIYLIKPLDKITLQSAIEGATRRLRSRSLNDFKVEDGRVFVKTKGKLVAIDPNKILFVESEGNYCYIHVDDYKLVVRSSLRGVIELLNNEIFLQCHRGYIVNFNHVTHVNITNDIIKVNVYSIPIGRKYKKSILDHFDNLL